MTTLKNREKLLVLTDLMTVLVSHDETGKTYGIIEETVPPLGGPPPHKHPDEEVFYIVEGDFEFILHDLENPFKAGAGSVVHVPSNAVHTFKNTGSATGRMIVILTPGNLLDYFRSIGESVTNESQIPDLSLVPNVRKEQVDRAFKYAEAHEVQFVMAETRH